MLRRQETGNPVTKGGKKGREIEISENRFKTRCALSFFRKGPRTNSRSSSAYDSRKVFYHQQRVGKTSNDSKTRLLFKL